MSMKIILKNSNGVDKSPLDTDLEVGEIAINTVSGVMHTKIQTSQGNILASTDFYNFINSSVQPIFTIPATAFEKDVIEINVENYDPATDYYVRITGGIIDTSSNPFKWTLPSISTDEEVYGIAMSAKEQGKIESKPTPYQYIDVMNVEGIVDDMIYLDNSNIDSSDFDTLTNAEVHNGEIRVTDDNVLIETVNFEQDSDDGDWTQLQPTVYIKHKNLLDTTNVTSLDLNRIKITEDASIDAGDIIYVKQDGEIKEVEVGAVETNVPFYEFEHLTIGNTATVFLDSNNKIFINGSFSYNLLSNLKFKKIEVSPTVDFAYAITLTNELYVIGDNSKGQLGLGDISNRDNWTFTGKYARDIQCSNYYGAFISTDNVLYVTGLNDKGQLGLGDNDDRDSFTEVAYKCTAMALGYKTMYVIEDNVLYVTGLNDKGQLGLGDNDDRNVLTSTNKEAYEVYIQDESGYFIDLSGKVYSTGSNDKYQLILDDATDRNEWTETDYKASELYVGTKSLYLVDTNDKLYSIGLNDKGQLGLGDTDDKTDLTEVNISLYKIFVSNKSVLLINLFKEILATGENQNNKFDLINNSDVNSFTFSRKALIKSTVISNFTPSLSDNVNFESYEVNRRVPTVAVSSHAIMINQNGEVLVRGYNKYGQLGLGDTDDRDEWTATGFTDAMSVAAGDSISFVIKNDKTLWSVGQGRYYKTGLNSEDNTNTFTFTGLTNVEKVSVFKSSVYAVTTDGSLYVTGENSYGQLGINKTYDVKVFTRVPLREKIIDVSGGFYHAAIIYENGDLATVGLGEYGRLGLNSSNDKHSFTKVFIKAKKVICSDYSTVIIDTFNKVKVAGAYKNGALGINESNDKYVFTEIFNYDDHIAKDIGSSYYGFIMIDNNNDVWYTGYNSHGQSGLGDEDERDYLHKVDDLKAKYVVSTSDSIGMIVAEDNSVLASGYLSYKNRLDTADTSSFIDLNINILPYRSTSIATTTTFKEYPESIYKKTIILSFSATNDDAKDFNNVDLIGIPTPVTSGLLYKFQPYDFSDDSKRKISLKLQGLLKDESVISIRLDLEKKN